MLREAVVVVGEEEGAVVEAAAVTPPTFAKQVKRLLPAKLLGIQMPRLLRLLQPAPHLPTVATPHPRPQRQRTRKTSPHILFVATGP